MNLPINPFPHSNLKDTAEIMDFVVGDGITYLGPYTHILGVFNMNGGWDSWSIYNGLLGNGAMGDANRIKGDMSVLG